MAKNNEVQAETPEVIEAVPVEETVEAPKKRTREKTRPVEECANLPVSKLTDKEKDKLITELKESIHVLATQREMYAQNAEQAHKTVRDMEAKFNEMEQFYRNKLQFIDTQLTAFGQAVTNVTKGGLN